jgi:hypothetical protein
MFILKSLNSSYILVRARGMYSYLDFSNTYHLSMKLINMTTESLIIVCSVGKVATDLA